MTGKKKTKAPHIGITSPKESLPVPVAHLGGTEAQPYELDAANRHNAAAHRRPARSRHRHVSLRKIIAAALVFVVATAGWKLYKKPGLLGGFPYKETKLTPKREERKKHVAPAEPLVPQSALDEESLKTYEEDLEEASQDLKNK